MKSLNVKTFIVFCLLVMIALPANAEFRIRGSVGADAYGYQDHHQEDHLLLIQNTRFSINQLDGKWNMYFSGGYIGDNADDFSNSGRGRFLRGHLNYGKMGDATRIKLGRFFVYQGVALGVVDGIEFKKRMNKNVSFSVHGGLMGPYSRQFELEDPDKALTFGGEVSFTPSNCRIADYGNMRLSFNSQDRENGTVRQLVGLSTYNKWGRSLRLMNTVHFRTSGNVLRKFVSRLRYMDHSWNLLGELGVITPDITDYSWFSGFGNHGRSRIRLAADRYLVPKKWAAGLDMDLLLASGNSGFRGGPVVTTPWGKAGYRFSGGDLGLSSGPWVSVHYNVTEGLDVHAYGAIVSYEWDAFDIETEDLTSFHAGFRYTPKFMESMILHAEYQTYETPQLSSDTRALGGLTWRFDTRRKS